MSNEYRLVPASEYGRWEKKVAAAIDKLPAAQVRASRRATSGDMELAFQALGDEWRVEIEGAGRSWVASLYCGDEQRLGMYAYGKAKDEKIAIQGFDEEGLDVIAQAIADRAGPQVLEYEGGGDTRLFVPRAGAVVEPPPPKRKPKPAPKPVDEPRMFAPIGAVLDDLDPVLRSHVIANIDDPEDAARWVTLAEMTKALAAVVRAHRAWKLTTSGTGKSWRAVLASKRSKIELAAAKERFTIAGYDDDVIGTLGQALTEIAGPQVLVVGDEGTQVFFPSRLGA